MLFLRSILIYMFLIFSIRLLGKRQLGEMEPSEFVVSLLIADLAATSMQDTSLSLAASVIPITTVLLLELMLSSLSYHFITVRKLTCGKPVILMENGKINQQNLRRTRVTLDELTEHLREKGIVDLSTVKYAILETNGQISVLLASEHLPLTAGQAGIQSAPQLLPFTIISNGKLLKKNLTLSGKSENWLHKQLKKHDCKISQVLLFTVDTSGTIYIALKQK